MAYWARALKGGLVSVNYGRAVSGQVEREKGERGGEVRGLI